MSINAFVEFSVILTVAALLGSIAVKFKQPPILGYILAGLLLGPLTSYFDPRSDLIELLASIGVTFLLFTLGLELNFSELKHVGKVAFVTGIGQIVFTSVIGYIIAIWLGFSSIASFFIAIGLTFSSTIIIVKLLAAKNQLDTLYGRISVGFLLVQDFIAILILIGISAIKNVDASSIVNVGVSLFLALVKAIIVLAIAFVLTRYLLNPLLDSLKNEKEVIFLITLAWALFLAAVYNSEHIGFTKEVGGLIAGILLSNRFEQLQLESWTRPLRDFFLALFFVLLGANIHVSSLSDALLPTIIFSIFVLIGNPLIVMILMGWLGYTKKTSFLTSLAVAQISEFSLILVGYAYTSLGVVDNVTLAIMALVGGITMTLSSYMIYYNEKLYSVLSKYLGLFEFKKTLISADSDLKNTNLSKKIVLFGCHRMGRHFLLNLDHHKSDILIVDIDPQNVHELKEMGYDVIYADMSDSMMYPFFHLDNAEIVISTVPSIKENLKLLDFIRDLQNKPIIIVTANNNHDVVKLYDAGADFVVYPHLVSSELLAKIAKKGKLDKKLVKSRTMHMEKLSKIV
ncbi:MAG: potassium efflux system protein [Candidatus Dojkabacteria bacterium]|nr:MAG: potassium efflux system protein [Candidatus Dojkabacteria bacterium]